MVEERDLATGLLDLIKESTFEDLAEWRNIKQWFRVIHEDSPMTSRQALLETWSKVESPVRVLICSSLSELDLIVPDVESIIVFSDEGPKAMGPRWQRMARMEHQRGNHLQIIRLDEHSSDEYKKWGNPGCFRDTALELLGGDNS